MFSLFAYFRLIAWKLADNTFLCGDIEGLRELMCPGPYPGGLLEVASRYLMLVGLSDAWWWVPFAVGGVALGLLARATFRGPRWIWILLGLLWVVFPLALTNWYAWTTSQPAFPMMRLLGGCVTFGLFLGVRPFIRRSNKALVPAVLLCAFGHVPFGAYALAAGVLCLGYHVWRHRESFFAPAAALLLLIAVHPAVCRLVYEDVNLRAAWQYAHGEQQMIDMDLDAGPSLTLERAVRAGDWEGVLAEEERARAAGRDYPLRMEISWRLLAQARLGRLPEDLFAFPIRTHHQSSDADQRLLDGYELYYRFGFLLPARREIMERMCGWFLLPHTILRAGDIAFLQGSTALAEKYYARLARYPGHRAEAAARQAMLTGKAPVPADLEVDRAWADVVARNFAATSDRVFFESSKKFESFVHRSVRMMTELPESFVRLRLAGLLLEGDVPAILADADVVESLYPAPKPWPRPLQEALLAYAEAEGSTQLEVLAALRPGVIEPETAARYVRFREATKGRRPKDDAATDRIRRLFGDTFWFYDWWVLQTKKGRRS